MTLLGFEVVPVGGGLLAARPTLGCSTDVTIGERRTIT
ncbi:hypothetical protein HNR11_000359 [Nesterenkonia sandarakina]|uniref:Uncharacterized protein n=1 Tax=Nesterenkonia sandarakina TaxID=272918 RepID=A0A7Z0E681_9MICC|nr:hypothetical protein [Nesterenkonia sandarakina]